MDPNSIRLEGSSQDAVEVCGDTNNDDGNDDRHFCIKCKQTIIGLATYISHRRKGCNQVTNKVSFSFIMILKLLGSDYLSAYIIPHQYLFSQLYRSRIMMKLVKATIIIKILLHLKHHSQLALQLTPLHQRLHLWRTLAYTSPLSHYFKTHDSQYQGLPLPSHTIRG